jgi:hypothetical protein
MKKFIQLAISLLIIGGFIWLIYIVVKFAWRTLSSVNPSLAVGVIAAGSTIFVSVISVLISKHLEQKTIIKSQQREKKIPIYEELLAFLFKIWRGVKDEALMPSEGQIADFMFDFAPKLIVWGSDDVVTAFSKFRTDFQNPTILLFTLEELWLAIRKDLGHNNKGVTKGTLLGFIVNDIHEHLPKV